MFYDDDHLDYPGPIDYAAQDAADRAEEEAWLERLPWLTGQERSYSRLAAHPAFPDGSTDDEAYDAFATQLRRDSQRVVPCRFDLGSFRVRGKFDLVSGAAYVTEDGHDTLFEALEVAHIGFGKDDSLGLQFVQFADGVANLAPRMPTRNPERATLSEVLRARVPVVTATSLAYVVESLAKLGQLPDVTASVNGKRFGTFHPL